MGIFYLEKAFQAGKKITKNDFAPSEKYSSYTPARTSMPAFACTYTTGVETSKHACHVLALWMYHTTPKLVVAMLKEKAKAGKSNKNRDPGDIILKHMGHVYHYECVDDQYQSAY